MDYHQIPHGSLYKDEGGTYIVIRTNTDGRYETRFFQLLSANGSSVEYLGYAPSPHYDAPGSVEARGQIIDLPKALKAIYEK